MVAQCSDNMVAQCSDNMVAQCSDNMVAAKEYLLRIVLVAAVIRRISCKGGYKSISNKIVRNPRISVSMSQILANPESDYS